jgi:hypothetical protein
VAARGRPRGSAAGVRVARNPLVISYRQQHGSFATQEYGCLLEKAACAILESHLRLVVTPGMPREPPRGDTREAVALAYQGASRVAHYHQVVIIIFASTQRRREPQWRAGHGESSTCSCLARERDSYETRHFPVFVSGALLGFLAPAMELLR